MQNGMPKITHNKICYYIIFLIFASNFSACKKKEDNYQRPEINIISPKINQLYKIKDNIPISFTVRHNKAIKKINISLHDEQNNYFDGSYTFDFNASNIEKSFTFPINDKYKKSGIFTLLFKINDEKNEEYNHQHTIQISENNKYFRGFLFYNFNNNNNQTNIWLIDTNFNISNKHHLNIDFLNCGYNKKLQQIYVCSKKSGILQALSAEDFLPVWSVNFPNPYNQAYFTAFFNDDENIMAATNNYYLYNYRNNGTLRFTSTLLPEQIAKNIDINNDYWIVATSYKLGPDNFLNNYYAATGEIKSSLSFKNEILNAVFLKNKSQAIVFSAKNNNTYYGYYNPQTNLFASEGILLQELTNDIRKIDEQNFFLLTENKLIHFNDYTLYKNIIKTNLTNAQVFIEYHTQQAILKANDSLFFYAIPQMQLQQQIPFQHSILAIHALYQEQP